MLAIRYEVGQFMHYAKGTFPLASLGDLSGPPVMGDRFPWLLVPDYL